MPKAPLICATEPEGKVMQFRGEQGFTLIWAALMVLLMVIVGGALMYVSRLEAVLTATDASQVQALHIAEAGLDRALVEMTWNPGWTAGFPSQTLGDGTYAVTVTTLGVAGQRGVTSTGTVNWDSKG